VNCCYKWNRISVGTKQHFKLYIRAKCKIFTKKDPVETYTIELQIF